MQTYRRGGLPLERVILDLHSGRIVGDWGVYVVDGAALLFLALVITGMWRRDDRLGVQSSALQWHG
jgi:uncharacterized iron-regulated membrane protein